MGELKDTFELMHKRKKKKRARNRKGSTELLSKKGVEFESKNNGAHLIVQGKRCIIDFWPGTGKFNTRQGLKGRGIFNLLRLC